jgi:D-alanyl-D-alanine carboxypeptidase (penicillin-binding protein 5/6)
VPNPELDEQAASERPESPAAEPATMGSVAAAPGKDPAPKSGTPSAKAKKARRRFRRRTRVRAAGMALVLGAGAIAAVLTAHGLESAPEPDFSQVAPAYRGFAESLPWPGDGQTALWAEDVGSLGTCGDQRPVPIASVAKVMTAYVILRDHPLADDDPGPLVLVDQQAEAESFDRDESSAPVRAGQRLSERSLLELMLVPSANNVARLLARWDAGSQAAFVAEMNAASAALGMKNTTYTDPSGYDSTTRSTAVDQLRLARFALTDPTLLAMTAEPFAQVPDDTTVLSNTDALLGSDGVVGGKTGSSTPAGGALMWAAHRTVNGQDHLVLGVVLHQNAGASPDRGLTSALIVSRRLVEAMY